MTQSIGRVTVINAVGVTTPEQARINGASMRIGIVRTAMSADNTVDVEFDGDVLVECWVNGATAPPISQMAVVINDGGNWVLLPPTP